jgi:hypothetical protein
MPGTAISLRTSDNQGAAQRTADYILPITYPTADVQTALRAISVKRSGRPIILMGDRGRGKSHIMAVMHHTVASPGIVEGWLNDWGTKLGSEELKAFETVKGYVPISEPVHNHEYAFLWDLLFDRHPKGQYYKGQFESMAQPFPPRTLLEKMFEDSPTCLILDEFQTWYTRLPDKDPKTGILTKKYAFNFVQILSEIAEQRPELLILVISVLNNDNDVFGQIHRQGPVVIDFRGPSAKQDRQESQGHQDRSGSGPFPHGCGLPQFRAEDRGRAFQSQLPRQEIGGRRPAMVRFGRRLRRHSQRGPDRGPTGGPLADPEG